MTALSAKEASYLFAVVAETCQRCFDYFVPVVAAAVGSVAVEVARVHCTVACHPGGQTGLLIGLFFNSKICRMDIRFFEASACPNLNAYGYLSYEPI